MQVKTAAIVDPSITLDGWPPLNVNAADSSGRSTRSANGSTFALRAEPAKCRRSTQGKASAYLGTGTLPETKSPRSTMTANPSYPASDPAAEKIVSHPAMCVKMSVATIRLDQNRKG